jgi:hypothetical protein
MLQTYEGSCHCGQTRFRVTGDLSCATECNCSICTKKGFLHLIVHKDRFESLSGDTELASYEFNTRTAKHTFCKTCGIHAYYVPRSDPDKIDVNIRCLDGIDLATLHPTPFDGKNWDAAIKTRPPPSVA